MPQTTLLAAATDTPSAVRKESRYSRESLGQIAKAKDVIGMEVKNLQEEKLGKVDDLAVDMEAGRIVQVIVSAGGVLGIGDRMVAVPPGALTPSAKTLRLDMSKERIKAAPEFDLSKWPEYTQAERVTEVYRYYGETPYYTVESERAKFPANIDKASKIIGLPVQNLQEEKIGKIEDLMLDLRAGRILQTIVSAGGFLGLGDELSAVPPTAFRFNSTRNALVLDATKESLTQAPHFKSGQWPDFNDREYSVVVYRAYRVEPYFTGPDADNTKRNVRDRAESQLTPLDQGTSPADVDVTRRIRKEITDRSALSVNAKNIKVITRDGRVTLRGPVNNDEEKRVLGEIAKQIAPEQNVDNQLEVKREGKEY